MDHGEPRHLRNFPRNRQTRLQPYNNTMLLRARVPEKWYQNPGSEDFRMVYGYRNAR
jgi:hypothetical protein